jgi:hypothetical protein
MSAITRLQSRVARPGFGIDRGEYGRAQAKIVSMENFRDFQLGPDPFGHTWHALFKYLQTGISIRHSDSVDVCFVVENEDGGEKAHRVVVLSHPEIREFGKRTGRVITDTWCSRMAACKLRQTIVNGEDMDKEYLIVTPREIEEYDAAIRKWEAEWIRTHAA